MKNGLVYLSFNSSKQIVNNFNTFLSMVDPLSICIIDNASVDNSVDIFKQMGAKVHVNEVNVGFTQAINQGLQLLIEKNDDIEWIFVINPDVKCPPKWDELLLQPTLTSQKDVGIICARTVDEQNNVTHSGGIISSVPQLIYWPTEHTLGNGFSVVQQDAICTTSFRHRLKDSNVTEIVDWASFCVVALRVEMIKEIGLLDEKYFLYCSDSEYCIRAKQFGWKIFYNPVTFFHEGSGNVRQANSKIQELAKEDFRRFAR